MHTTNYLDTFIVIAADCPAAAGTPPTRPGTIAALQYEIIAASPYRYTSDDILVEVLARRRGVDGDRAALRAELFAKPQACLRASPLVKQYGFGLHHDGQGRVAAYGVETADYQRLTRTPG